MADPRFKTGALPSPRHRLLAAVPHRVFATPPPQAGYFPKQLSYWLNNQEGDCVSAEEAFAKASYIPEIFIPDDILGAWVNQHGFANGANLTDVMDAMKAKGFQIGSQLYNNGPYSGVDYTSDLILQSAISLAPVKIAIASSCLPSGAGNHHGWYSLGPTHDNNTDHCVALCAYGTAEWIYQQLSAVYGSVPMPSELAGKSGYALFTWNTIGFVDLSWLKGTVSEAWVRNPTTVGVPPLPAPTPPVPVPPVPPAVSLDQVIMWAAEGINASGHHELSKEQAIAAASAGLSLNWPS